MTISRYKDKSYAYIPQHRKREGKNEKSPRIYPSGSPAGLQRGKRNGMKTKATYIYPSTASTKVKMKSLFAYTPAGLQRGKRNGMKTKATHIYPSIASVKVKMKSLFVYTPVGPQRVPSGSPAGQRKRYKDKSYAYIPQHCKRNGTKEKSSQLYPQAEQIFRNHFQILKKRFTCSILGKK